MHEQQYFETLCNTGDGVFIVNRDKHIVRWNKGAERILKYSESEVLNQECFQVVDGRTSPQTHHCNADCSIYSGAVSGACQKNVDLLTRTKDGKPVWLNISYIASPDPDSPFLAHILRDVTREKNADFILNQLLEDWGALKPTQKEIGKTIEQGVPAEKDSPPKKQAALLSKREIEVLTMLAEGLSTKILAQRLHISHFTARNHIQNILVKLGLHSKAQAVSYAFKNGIL